MDAATRIGRYLTSELTKIENRHAATTAVVAVAVVVGLFHQRVHARLDAFFVHERGGLRFTEYNAETPAANKTCQVDTDCAEGQFCDNNACTDAPGKPTEPDPSSTGEPPPKKPDGGCATDADCPGTEICEANKCKAP